MTELATQLMIKVSTKIGIFLVAVLLATQAQAACERHTIQYVGDDLIVLDDDTQWETSEDTGSWNTGDEVLLCGDDKIVNTTQNEAVDVTER
jgi:hypothetical protein